METKNCPFSNQNFIPTRSNQVYADAKIRIKANNIKSKNLRQSLNYINQPLFQNFKVLSLLMNDKKEEEFHKQFLIGKGIDFKVITHYSSYNNVRLPNIYNFKIQVLENEKIKIIKE